MCGISGYVGNIDPKQFKKMTSKISHRGPDDTGFEFYHNEKYLSPELTNNSQEQPNVGLGHQRLAIIDLTQAGHQPMFNKDKSIALVFNGEIYNFQEIRAKLENKYEFVSNSDSEVIIHSYEEWGTDCLKYFNGMFAFVIYDAKNNLLFGARDRVGEKPLKYYHKDNSFIFASEVKPILEYLGESREMDPVAVDNFLTFQYVPAPRTGFKHISKLPAGHYFIYQNNKLEITKYWELDYSYKLNLPVEEWKTKVLEGLDKAVRQRLIADVEIGAFLSGGIDSSAVVAYMAKNSKNRIKTFSVGFNDPKFDETKFADIIAKKYDTDHTVFRLTADDLLNTLDDVFNYYDEPFADNSALPTFLLCKETSKHVTVALNGDGGDENFAGYERYNVLAFAEMYQKYAPKLARTLLANNFANLAFNLKPNKLTSRAKLFSNSFEEPFYRKYVNYNSIFTNESKWALYHDKFRQDTAQNDSYELFKTYYDRGLGQIDNGLKTDMAGYLPENLLYKTDIGSMAHGLELRSPLLDPNYMELTAKMSLNLKVNRFNKKFIFARALVDGGILPAEVVYRRKQGFNIPTNSWFKGKLKKYVQESILDGKLVEMEIFDRVKLLQYVEGYYTSELNYDNNMYALLALSKWLDRYF